MPKSSTTRTNEIGRETWRNRHGVAVSRKPDADKRETRRRFESLASAASDLLSIFEIPIHLSLSAKYSVEEIKNSFTAFRSSDVCADIWKTTVARYGGVSFDHTVVYTYYRSLMGMPDLEPWAFACLFLLIFPRGTLAIAERGFSAMGATHTKTRSQLSHEQVWAHMIVQFNGRNTESMVPNWWGHVAHCNYNN